MGVFVFALASIVATQNVEACRTNQMAPQEASLTAAPADSIAIKGTITKINNFGPMETNPHAGFQLSLRVVQVFKGTPNSNIEVEYGPCYVLPGEVGQTINVIASSCSNGKLCAK
jgi:hypothetical protein